MSAQIVGLDDARLTTDGLALAFTLKTLSGEMAVHIPTVDIGRIVAFFVAAGAYADETIGASERPWPTELDPVPAEGLGFATLDRNTAAVIVRLAGFDLAFRIPSSALSDTARELSPILAALSAGDGPRQ